jgi:hypothetical protein
MSKLSRNLKQISSQYYFVIQLGASYSSEVLINNLLTQINQERWEEDLGDAHLGVIGISRARPEGRAQRLLLM